MKFSKLKINVEKVNHLCCLKGPRIRLFENFKI